MVALACLRHGLAGVRALDDLAGDVGAWRDPVRNECLAWFAVLACFLVMPCAWRAGAGRGIPWGWRLTDAAFGVGGLFPAALDLIWTRWLASAGTDLVPGPAAAVQRRACCR